MQICQNSTSCKYTTFNTLTKRHEGWKYEIQLWNLSRSCGVSVHFLTWLCRMQIGKKKAQTTHWLYVWGIHTYIYIYAYTHITYVHSTYTHMHAYAYMHTIIYIYIYSANQILLVCTEHMHTQANTHTCICMHTHTRSCIYIANQILFGNNRTIKFRLFWNKSSNFSQIAKIHACMITLLWDQLLYADGFKIWNKTPYRFDLWRYVCLMRSFLLFASLWICQLHTHLPVQVSCRQGLHHRCVPVSGAWPPQLYGFPPKGLYKHHRFVSVDFTWLLCLYLAVHLDITVLVDWV